MTIATSRVQINTPTYMKVDGQWQIVYPGSIIDLDSTTRLSAASILPTFSEAPGTLPAHGNSASVRNLRTR